MILARKINRKKGNSMLKKGNFIEDLWKHCRLCINITYSIKSIQWETVNVMFIYRHGRTGRKKLGGRKEICPTFSDCARVVQKNFPGKLSKIVVDGGEE